MTLAAILAEAGRLPLGNDEEAFNTRGAWFSVYGPRLVAACRAAVEVAERWPKSRNHPDVRLHANLVVALDALAAIVLRDAAASAGERKQT